jgi:hypothetical protein
MAGAAANLSAAAVAAAAPPCSWNGDVCPEVPAADWATTRYSVESMPEGFAANWTQPELVAGSTVVYPPTPREMGVPTPVPHGVGGGVVVPFPLQPTEMRRATANHGHRTRALIEASHWGDAMTTSEYTSPPRRSGGASASTLEGW